MNSQLALKMVAKTWYPLLMLILMAAPSGYTQSNAKVVIYRKAGINNPRFTLVMNDRVIESNFTKRQYLTVECSPGEIIFEVLSSDPFTASKKFSMKVEAGNTYFLEGISDYQYFSTSLYLVKRNQATAEKELAKRQEKVVNLVTDHK